MKRLALFAIPLCAHLAFAQRPPDAPPPPRAPIPSAPRAEAPTPVPSPPSDAFELELRTKADRLTTAARPAAPTAPVDEDAAVIAARRLAALFDAKRVTFELVEATGLPERRLGGVVRSLLRARVPTSGDAETTIVVPEAGVVVTLRQRRGPTATVRALEGDVLVEMRRVIDVALMNAAESLPTSTHAALTEWAESKSAAAKRIAGGLPVSAEESRGDPIRTRRDFTRTRSSRAPEPKAERATEPAPDADDDDDFLPPNDPRLWGERLRLGHDWEEAEEGTADVRSRWYRSLFDDLARARTEAALGAERAARLEKLYAESASRLAEGDSESARASLEAALRDRADAEESARAALESGAWRARTKDAIRESARKALETSDLLRRRAAEQEANLHEAPAQVRDALLRAAEGRRAVPPPTERELEIAELRAEVDALRKEVDALRETKAALKARAEQKAEPTPAPAPPKGGAR